MLIHNEAFKVCILFLFHIESNSFETYCLIVSVDYFMFVLLRSTSKENWFKDSMKVIYKTQTDICWDYYIAVS